MMKRNSLKRNRILDAAYDLFIGKGYWDTKIIDIADAAGIGKGTVYEYFESKEDIFLELFETKVASGYEPLSELPEKDLSGADKLKEYIDIELTNASKYTFSKNFLMDLMMKSDAFRNPKLIEAIHKLVSKKFAILYGIIENGIKKGEFRETDPMLATISIMGAVNLFIGIHYLPFDPAEFLSVPNQLDWSGDELFKLILKGLEP